MNTYVGKDGRVRVAVKRNNKWSTISYSRILMEEKLGRPLEPYEDVHHIDGDPSNNDLENLIIINHGEHQRQHNPQKYFDIEMICDICGRSFLKIEVK